MISSAGMVPHPASSKMLDRNGPQHSTMLRCCKETELQRKAIRSFVTAGNRSHTYDGEANAGCIVTCGEILWLSIMSLSVNIKRKN